MELKKQLKSYKAIIMDVIVVAFCYETLWTWWGGGEAGEIIELGVNMFLLIGAHNVIHAMVLLIYSEYKPTVACSTDITVTEAQMVVS
jgi:hypothetical protein